ncbi:MAG: TatD family deoxyribonuclease [Bacteroidetes bacterium CHB5]|nr:TatD family deoxyribonuclease [Bacteroidetes bacterium CHB5]
MSFWIDTHAHIYTQDFDTDRHEVLAQCTAQGVNRIYMPNVDHTSIDAMLEIEAKFPNQCIAMMGLHPCSVKKDFEKELYLVESWLQKKRFAAIGEIGTDLYWDKTFWEQQQEAFKIQTGWAKQYKLPLVIHCRQSIDETIALLEPFAGPALTGVFHCFSGTIAQANKIVSLGFYLGIGGVATFKNGGLDTVIPQFDINRLVLETDSPYLAPVPHRGKRNTPEYIPLIAARVAALRNMPVQELMEHTYSNASKLFKE